MDNAIELYTKTFNDADGNLRGGYFQARNLIDAYPSVHLWYFIGQRGIGKTYDVKNYVLEKFFSKSKQFIFVRRVSPDVTSANIADVFADISSADIIKLMLKCHYPNPGYQDYAIQPKAGKFWLVGINGVGEKDDFLEPLGIITCISFAERFKNNTFNQISAIIFDEFITEKGYIGQDGEPEWFSKIVNTVGRIKNKDLMIFMLGNPDYNMAACPYLYTLHLDFPRLQKDNVYLFDSKIERKNGVVRTIANNVGFIWLKGVDGVLYLSPHTSNLWGTAEERMGLTGDMKTEKFLRYDTIADVFTPCYEMCVETAVFSGDYKKCLWCYPGLGRAGEPVIVVLGHRLKDAEVPRLDCRYDQNIYVPKSDIPCVYRLNIPPADRYKKLAKLLNIAIVTKLIYSDDDTNGTLFYAVLESK